MAAPTVPYTRALKLGSKGKDVLAVKRALAREGSYKWPRVRRLTRVAGPGFISALRRFQEARGVTVTGRYCEATHYALRHARKAAHTNEWAYDALAVSLMKEASEKKPMIEPRQGWKSLMSSLHEAFSEGRSMGLTDLGTYNPASKLPSGSPSDHSVYPACAFDLGCVPATGWDNLTARAFFKKMVGRPEVNYVILGDKIWSVERGLHDYAAGGHMNHVHVSGKR